MNPEQHLLLATQLQQHVQLMAQHFVMAHMHPENHSLAKVCKQNLNSLRYDDVTYSTIYVYQVYSKPIKL